MARLTKCLTMALQLVNIKSTNLQMLSVVSRTRNWGIPQLLPLLAQNVNIYAPTNTNHFKHWRTCGNLLRNISIIFKSAGFVPVLENLESHGI